MVTETVWLVLYSFMGSRYQKFYSKKVVYSNNISSAVNYYEGYQLRGWFSRLNTGYYNFQIPVPVFLN